MGPAEIDAWVTQAIEGAKAASGIRRQEFFWTQRPGASLEEIERCEAVCNIDLSPSHREILLYMDGAEIVFRFDGTLLKYELLSTSVIATRLPELRAENDASSPANRPETLWNDLIPVFDLGDTQYLLSDPGRRDKDEYEVFYGYLESGPEEWRGFPAFASTVDGALRKILESFIETDGIIWFY